MESGGEQFSRSITRTKAGDAFDNVVVRIDLYDERNFRVHVFSGATSRIRTSRCVPGAGHSAVP